MACISKITNAISYDCSNGFVGFSRAAIINKDDIASLTIEDGVVTALTLASPSSAYRVATQRKSFSVVETARVNENAPNAFSHEATITVFEKENPSLFNQLVNGNAVIIANHLGYYRIFGAYYGMRTSASNMSSSENGGWATFTLSTPEGVIGEDYLTVDLVVGDGILSGAQQ